MYHNVIGEYKSYCKVCKMTTSLYFEKYIASDKINTRSLISLSELQRTFDKTNTVEGAREYYEALITLCNNIRYRRIRIKEHPHFQFNNHTSTNWTFELIRVASLYKDLLVTQAGLNEDLKEKNKILLEAMKLTNDCSKYATSIFYMEGDNALFKYMNPQYHLSQTLNIAADRFYNMYLFKTNALAIKKAFQMKELSFLIWKDANLHDSLIKYKATALLELAKKLEDDECGQKLALLQAIVTKDECPEEVMSQYLSWKQQNEQVYYKPVVTDKKLDVISLEEAFGILSKSFETLSK